MQPDEQHEAYHAGYEACVKHTSSSPQTLEIFNSVDEKLDTIINRLDILNGKVAKHNEWIDRYDIRIAEEVPEMKKQVEDNTKKIYAGIAVLGALQVGLSFIIK